MASIYQQFNFPSNETLNNNNQLLQDQVLSSDKVVKNLTAQFLQDDQNQLQPLDENLKKKIDGKKSNGRCSVYFANDFTSISNHLSNLTRKKSLSDSNLAHHQSYERRRKAKTAIGDNTVYMNENEKLKNSRPMVRSEMRDSTIIRDPSLFFNNNQILSPNYSTGVDFDYSFKPNEISVLSSYLSRAVNLSDSNLKIEYETLCHELFYERYLREKYEEYFNMACAIRVENEQLILEKAELVCFRFI